MIQLYTKDSNTNNSSTVKHTLSTLLFLFIATLSNAQNNVGIGTTSPNNKAILELQATDKGLLVPRLTTVQMNGIVTTASENGLIIYNTDSACYHFYNGTIWRNLCVSALDTTTVNTTIDKKAWLLKGNNAPINNKLGTLNAQDLHIYAGGTERITLLNGNGNVGIGQLLPTEVLDVTGSVKFSNALMPAGITGVTGELLVSQGAGIAPQWQSGSTLGGSLNGVAWTLLGNSGTNSAINFLGTTDAQDIVIKTNSFERLRIASTGQIGAGTVTPTYGLDLRNAGSSFLCSSGWAKGVHLSSQSALVWDKSGGTNYFFEAKNATDIYQGLLSTDDGLSAPNYITRIDEITGDWNLLKNAYIDGSVGIATLTPTEKLDVVGNIKFSNALMPAGIAGAIGELLVSQGASIAPQWQSGSTLGGSLNGATWTLLGNSGTNYTTNFIGTTDNTSFRIRTNNTEQMIVDSIGNVGIRTSTPITPLHVNGNYGRVGGDSGPYDPLHASSAIFNIENGNYTGGEAHHISFSSNRQPLARMGVYNNTIAGNIDVVNSQFYINTDPSENNAWANPNFVIQGATGNVGINTSTPLVALHVATTDGIAVPTGTTGQQPVGAPVGTMRYNTTLGAMEVFNGTLWLNINTPPIGATYTQWLAAADPNTIYPNTTWISSDIQNGEFLRATGGNANVSAGGLLTGTTQTDGVQDHTHNGSGSANGSGALTTTNAGTHDHNWGGNWSIDDSRVYTSDNGDGNGNTLSDGRFWWGGSGATGSTGTDYNIVGNTTVNGAHNHTGATTTDGNHGHTQGSNSAGVFYSDPLPAEFNNGLAGGGNFNDAGASGISRGGFTTSIAGNHNHTFTTNADGNHSHNLEHFAHRHWIKTRPTTTAPDHAHTVPDHGHTLNVTIGTMNSGNASTETRPVNVAVKYWRRIN